MADNTETSLRDDLAAGMESADVSAPEVQDVTPAAPPALAPPIPPELPALEAPSVWGKQYKEAFSKVAQSPEQRAYAEAWLGQWKETQGYVTKREQELADYRKRYEPIGEMVGKYEPYWQMQGMDARQGLGQLLGYAEALARDPRSVLPQLAQMYGVDLQELIAEQPYIDPQVQTLQQEIQALKQQQQFGYQQSQQQQQSRLLEEIHAFETAADESGNPKAPHFARVFDRMIGLARGGLANSIHDAYEMAVSMDKELQSDISQQRANQEAASRAAEAKKALDASKTVKSKATEGVQAERSLRDELAAQLEAAGYQ